MDRAEDLAGDFERWARIAAQLRGRTVDEKRHIARSLGIEQVWEEVDEDWAQRLRADVAAGATERPNRYLRICREDVAARTESFSAQGTEPGEPFRTRLDAAPVAGAPLVSPEDFRGKLAPTAPVTRPSPGQLETQVHSSANASAESKARAREAMNSWPIEQYAQLCADLGRAQSDPERERIWAAAGIVSVSDQLAVQRHWALKIAADPALRARWQTLGGLG